MTARDQEFLGEIKPVVDKAAQHIGTWINFTIRQADAPRFTSYARHLATRTDTDYTSRSVVVEWLTANRDSDGNAAWAIDHLSGPHALTGAGDRVGRIRFRKPRDKK
jgi:hypothetical protein